MASQALLSGCRQPCLPCCSSAPSLPALQQQRHRRPATAKPTTVCQSLPFDASSAQGHVLSRGAGSRLRRVLKNTRQRIKDTQSALGAVALQLGGGAAHQALDVPASLETELRLLSERLKQLAVSPDSSLDSDLDSPRTHATTTTTTTLPRTVSTPALEPLELPAGIQPLPPCAQGRVLVCQGSKCQAAGAMHALRTASALAAGCSGVEVLPSKCLGKCKLGPVVRVKGPEVSLPAAAAAAAGEGAVPKPRGADRLGHLYTQVTEEVLAQAMHQHCVPAPAAACEQQ